MSSSGRDSASEPGDVATDLVGYLIVVMPNLESLSALVPGLAELVGSGMMRILDVVIVERDTADAVSVYEPEALEGLAPLASAESGAGALLGEHDVELASLAVRAGMAGMVLVIEDRWARPLAAAVREAGGEIVAGERVPSARVEAVLADATAPNGEFAPPAEQD